MQKFHAIKRLNPRVEGTSSLPSQCKIQKILQTPIELINDKIINDDVTLIDQPIENDKYVKY